MMEGVKRASAFLLTLALSCLAAEARANCLCRVSQTGLTWECTIASSRTLCLDDAGQQYCLDQVGEQYCALDAASMETCFDFPVGALAPVACDGACTVPPYGDPSAWYCYDTVPRFCYQEPSCTELMLPDAGVDRDAGVGGQDGGHDGGPAGGPDAGPGLPPPPEGFRFSGGAGCGCRAAGGVDPGLAWLVVMLVAGLLRGRR